MLQLIHKILGKKDASLFALLARAPGFIRTNGNSFWIFSPFFI